MIKTNFFMTGENPRFEEWNLELDDCPKPISEFILKKVNDALEIIFSSDGSGFVARASYIDLDIIDPPCDRIIIMFSSFMDEDVPYAEQAIGLKDLIIDACEHTSDRKDMANALRALADSVETMP